MSENQLIIDLHHIISLHKILIQALTNTFKQSNQLMMLIASHPMCEISTIYQHTSFNPNSRSRIRLTQSAICYSMRALGHPLLSSLVMMLSNLNVFRLLPGNSFVTLRSPLPIIGYKNLNKCFIFFGKNHFRGFLMTLLEFTKKIVAANNYKQYGKLIQ